LWDADEVRAWTRPGQGARTDLKETPMTPVAPAEPVARAVYGREIHVRGRVFRAVHVDGYAHIDLLTRREPRFESDRDAERPGEWGHAEPYTTLGRTFDDAGGPLFDAWGERDLRAELD